jgi:hypothetical protein
MKQKLVMLVFTLLEAHAIAAPSAEELYDQGQAAYNNAAYATAIAKWTQAYKLSGAHDLLFNIAQAHRLDGDCIHALSMYKRFVEADRKSEQRALADGFITELEPKCGASTRPRHVDRRNTLKVVGLVTGGGGVTLVVTGLLFGHRAAAIGNEVTATCDRGCDWAVQKDKEARGRRYEKIGYALDAVGLLAIAGGSVMYYLGRESTVMVVPSAHSEAAVVSWSGSW